MSVRRTALALALWLAACSGEKPAAAPTRPDPVALKYAAWNDPASVDQLLELEDDPLNGDVPEMIEELIAAALEGVPADAGAKTRMLHLIWYIHTHFVAGTPEPSYTTRRALEQRIAECGGSSIILQLAARRLGYPTRGVGFFGVPIQASHTAVEVYWDDAWHYLDPSFGVFFTDDGTFEGDIVDIETMLLQRDVGAANAFYPVAEGRLGRAYKSPKPATVAEMFGKTQIDLPFSGDYTLFLPHAVAASTYTPEAVLETEYAVDLAAGTYDIGAVDQSGSDITMHTGDSNRLDGASLAFVGDLSTTHGVLYGRVSFRLTGVEPGRRVTWVAHTLDDNIDRLDVEVRKAKVLALTRQGNQIRVVATALRDEVEINLSASRADRILFDAHRFSAD